MGRIKTRHNPGSCNYLIKRSKPTADDNTPIRFYDDDPDSVTFGLEITECPKCGLKLRPNSRIS